MKLAVVSSLVAAASAGPCASTEYCCPDAKACLTPSNISCAADEKVCDGDFPVCCPVTKLCVKPGNPCQSKCEDQVSSYCCPDAKHCLKPTNPGSLCAADSDCGANGVCCPLTKLCVAVAEVCDPADVEPNANILTFDGAKQTSFDFKELNDPVMGGQSTGTWTLGQGFGIMDGEVVDVPKLQAPGFIKAAADGKFPDVSKFIDGNLVLKVRSTTADYKGYRVTFVSGAASPSFACAAGGSLPFSRGCFKQKFTVPAGSDFSEVKLPFNSFSDKWSSATGEQTTTCAQDKDVCPTAAKLSSIQRVEFWAEGASGKVHLEVESVYAESKDGVMAALV